MLEFDDVISCKDVAEFNDFVSRYLEERKLQGEERRKTYWALFYRWTRR
jgi:hypothetical protein